MKNKKNRAFTLIELLAVVLILGIISLIAIPLVGKTIKTAKEKTLKLSLKSIINDISIKYYNDFDEQYYIVNNGKITNSSGMTKNINKNFKDGIIYKNEKGNFAANIYTDGYCVIMPVDSEEPYLIAVNSSDDCFPQFYKGETVLLRDGSEWYFMYSKGDKLVLMSKSNLSIGNTFVQDDNDTNYTSTNAIPFDFEDNRLTSKNSYCKEPFRGCNIYESNGTTVVQDSSIKGIVQRYYNQLLKKNVITKNSIVRLPTLNDLEILECNIGDKTRPGTCLNSLSFIRRTSYWLQDAKNDVNSWDVWFVATNGDVSYDMASRYTYGFRPVIEIPKYLVSGITSSNVMKGEKNTTYAVWMWMDDVHSIIDNNLEAERIVELKNNKINTVYLSLDPESIMKYQSIISEANKQGIRIYALFGDPGFIKERNYKNVIKHNMNRVAQFNDANEGKARIEGIHYDVEYYLLNEEGSTCIDGQSKEAKNSTCRLDFVTFTREAKKYANILNLKVEYDITAYTTNMVSFYDKDKKEKVVLDEIIKNADGLTIMSYGNSPKNTYDSILYKGEFTHFNGDPRIKVKSSYFDKLVSANIEIVVGQEFDVFKRTYNEIKDNPSLASSSFPEYQVGNINEYKYTRNFIKRMQLEIMDVLNNKLKEKNIDDKIGFAYHHYHDFLEVINLPE